jgi:arylformamidase
VTRLWDITPRVSPALAVFPGDTSLSREILMDMKRGHHVTVSTLRATVHLGAHVDAPSHYGRDGKTIDEMPLELFIGRCQVMRVSVSARARIAPADLSGPIVAERLLLRTGTHPDPDRWTNDFAALSVELVDHLAEAGVKLIGIDTPSVDLADSKDLPAHRQILERDLAILEGIVLDGVPDGVYELIALPLRLVGFDASPVRALLRS